MMHTQFSIFILSLQMLLSVALLGQSSSIVLSGAVIDKDSNAVEFATVSIAELQLMTETKSDGSFTLSLPRKGISSVIIQVSYVGKKTVYQSIDAIHFHQPIVVRMEDESLTLSDVVVTATRKQEKSISSIVFDQEAIKQAQAFSLIDVLNHLPGRKSTAPNLQSPQTLTLRTNASGVDAMNNSFGIAIYVDGVRINKDANMQARGVSIRGMSSSAINAYGQGSFDVAYNGFDLRDFPIDNIERIEVVQGVADAKYGEISSGAIFITTKAGRTPYSINVSNNGGSYSLSLSKGFSLGKKWGALNISSNYLNSNSNPIDRIKSYGRIGQSFTWSFNVHKLIKNTFSFSFDKRIDDVKRDPDDDAERLTYAKGENYAFSNRTSFDFKNKILQNIQIAFSHSRGVQETYAQWLLNTLPKAIADKDTMGVYEGYYVPGNYLAVEQILGKPISMMADIDVHFAHFYIGNTRHKISFGYNINSSGNIGKGLVIDPSRPRFSNLGGQNLRSFSYVDSVKLNTTMGLYWQDNFSGKLWKRRFTVNLGVRYSVQNGSRNIEPRLSGSYAITKHIQLSGAYGIATRSPSLAHLYPGTTYYDIPLLNLYTGYAANSLYLVYTHKIPAVNIALRNSFTRHMEVGIQYQSIWGNISLNAFHKMNKLGYQSIKQADSISVPIYDYTLDANKKIHYFNTFKAKQVVMNRNVIGNHLSSIDKGAELMLQTQTLQYINTNFSVRAAYYVSAYDNNIKRLTTKKTLDDGSQVNESKDYLFMNAASLVTGVSANTQIPSIGFIFSLSTDMTVFDNDNYLATDSITGTSLPNEPYQVKQPKFYAIWNLSISKEIKKKIRLSLKVYNLFNQRPYDITDFKNNYITYYATPISVTAGLHLTL